MTGHEARATVARVVGGGEALKTMSVEEILEHTTGVLADDRCKAARQLIFTRNRYRAGLLTDAEALAQLVQIVT